MGNIDSLPAVQLTPKEGKNNTHSFTDVCFKQAILSAIATQWNGEILISSSTLVLTIEHRVVKIMRHRRGSVLSSFCCKYSIFKFHILYSL